MRLYIGTIEHNTQTLPNTRRHATARDDDDDGPELPPTANSDSKLLESAVPCGLMRPSTTV